MKINKILTMVFVLACFCLISSLHAGYVFKNGWFVDSDELVTMTCEEHFKLGVDAMKSKNWKEAAKQLRIVSVNFPKTPEGQEATFLLGIAYYKLDDLEVSNDVFSLYLKENSNLRHFEEAINYKYHIADLFKNGATRHFFGTKHLPKLASGRSLAETIFEEIVATVPCHPLAAQSLKSRAEMLREDGLYKESIETYQQLIRRFPKHEYAPQSYVAISEVYLDRSMYEAQNPDLLDFAEINLKRFQQDFPRDDQITVLEMNLLTLKENYANSLYETGQFYERTHHPKASLIYYQNAIKKFPDTKIAQRCQERFLMLTGSKFTPQAKPEQGNAQA